MMSISVIIPVFNEEKTIGLVVEHLNKVDFGKNAKEIIIVNDGSSDNTAEEIDKLKKKYREVIALHHEKNKGKGVAVKTGINAATGEYIIIQDADQEYNPSDIPSLLEPILSGKTKIVYGTRLKRMPDFSRDERSVRFLLHYIGNKFLSLLISVLYGQWVTDMETGYKVFPKKYLDGITLRSRSFELEPEITAKFMKRGYKIVEVPISTNPRNYKEGKKLHTVRDGLIALWTIFKYRFTE